MRLGEALSIGDIERLAKRRLPRVVYEGIASGVEDERGLVRNEAEFHRHRLVPRAFADVTEREQTASLFGRNLRQPVRHFADWNCRNFSPRC